MPLIAELKRRNVFKVAMAYLALGWVITQVAGTMAPYLRLPEWTVPMVVMIGVIGFPCVLIFSWVYELTPEGLKRENEIDRSQSITNATGKRLDYTIIGLLVAAIGITALDRVSPREPSTVGAGPARDSSVGEGRAQGALLPGQVDADRAQGESRDLSEAELRARRARGTDAELGGSQGGMLATPAPDTKSIAVLPFVNMSSDKEQEYFSDGISEELLNLLAKIPELKVIARTSSFAFKGKEVDIADIARKLNVAHVLEGSVRKSGNTVRITTQLVRATDSTHLWSETYDRPLDNIFAVQDEIAGAVVSQLKIKLLGAAPSAKPVDPRVYPLLLQAQALGNQASADASARAVELYQQVLAITPEDARAWSGLGRIYLNQTIAGQREATEGRRLAREAQQKALALDPDDALIHSRIAGILWRFDNDLAGASSHNQRALALDPANAGVLANTASFMNLLGRSDQSISLFEYIATRDPANPIIHHNLGNSYFYAGRRDEAIDSWRTALTLSPGRAGAHALTGVALLYRGDAAAALVEMQAEPVAAYRLCGTAMAEHSLAHPAESDAALADLVAGHAQDGAFQIAMVHAWRDEAGPAFEWLDRAVANQEIIEVAHPVLVTLHDDPRWLPFLRRIGRAPEQLAAIQLDVKLPQ